MTAKELSELAKFDVSKFTSVCNFQYVFTENQFKAFCEQLCREQREICKTAYLNHGFGKDIENAPMPEL